MTGQRAQTRLVARQSGRESNLSQLGKILLGLPEGDKGFLKWTGKIILSTQDISDLQDRLSTQLRPFLREPTAALLVEKLKNLHSQIAGYPEPLASEFRPAVANWLKIAESQHENLLRLVNQNPNHQVFRAGDPVDRGQEAFVPRDDVLEELDQQLTLATGCPGLIIYGRRRTGKSTLLNNLAGFIPETIRVARVSMQNPELFTSQAMLLERIAQELLKVCPDATPSAVNAVELATAVGRNKPAPAGVSGKLTGQMPETVGARPYSGLHPSLNSMALPSAVARLPEFFALLTACNEALKSSGQRLLLAIDEYENIDEKIGLGVFDEDWLATLR